MRLGMNGYVKAMEAILHRDVSFHVTDFREVQVAVMYLNLSVFAGSVRTRQAYRSHDLDRHSARPRSDPVRRRRVKMP